MTKTKQELKAISTEKLLAKGFHNTCERLSANEPLLSSYFKPRHLLSASLSTDTHTHTFEVQVDQEMHLNTSEQTGIYNRSRISRLRKGDVH